MTDLIFAGTTAPGIVDLPGVGTFNAARDARVAHGAATAPPPAAAPAQDIWADVKTLLDAGATILRIVELALLFA